MCTEDQSVGIVYQCVSCNSGNLVVCFAETTVDDNDFAAAFDRALAFSLMYRHMSVDDVPLRRIQSKLSEKTVYHFFVFQKTIICTFHFFVRCLVCNKISFKCCHLVFAEQRGVRARPDKPEDIPALTLLFVVHSKKRSPYISLQYIIEFFALVSLAIDLDFLETSILIQRNTSVEQKVSVESLVETAFV